MTYFGTLVVSCVRIFLVPFLIGINGGIVNFQNTCVVSAHTITLFKRYRNAGFPHEFVRFMYLHGKHVVESSMTAVPLVLSKLCNVCRWYNVDNNIFFKSLWTSLSDFEQIFGGWICSIHSCFLQLQEEFPNHEQFCSACSAFDDTIQRYW